MEKKAPYAKPTCDALPPQGQVLIPGRARNPREREGGGNMYAIRMALAAATMLALSGCATAPTDLAMSAAPGAATNGGDFDNDNDKGAILIFAAANYGFAGGFYLRQVDLKTSSFGEKTIHVGYGAWGIGDKIQSDSRSGLMLLAKAVPPGDYVAAKAYWTSSNGYSTIDSSLCMARFGVVFTVQPGQVNVVRSSDAFPPGVAGRFPVGTTDQVVLDQFASARKNYPGIVGDPIIARPRATITWEGKSSLKGALLGDSCTETKAFSVTKTFEPSANGLAN